MHQGLACRPLAPLSPPAVAPEQDGRHVGPRQPSSTRGAELPCSGTSVGSRPGASLPPPLAPSPNAAAAWAARGEQHGAGLGAMAGGVPGASAPLPARTSVCGDLGRPLAGCSSAPGLQMAPCSGDALTCSPMSDTAGWPSTPAAAIRGRSQARGSAPARLSRRRVNHAPASYPPRET